MAKIDSPTSIREFPLALIKNMISLATSGFGVVVALAWNDAIKKAVETFIDPYLGKSSGVISLAIYAIIMTTLAVVVTMQLSFFERRLLRLAVEEEANEAAKNGQGNKTTKPATTAKKP